MLRRLLAPVIGVCALLAPVTASAMSCDEIMNMVSLNIPTNIVIETMKGSGQTFSEADIACLQQKGAPPDVLAAAKGQSGGAAVKAPTPSPAPAPAMPTESFETDETLGNDFGTAPPGGGDDEGNVDDEEPGGSGPADLTKAIEDQRAKKHLGASLALYEMLRDNRYPDQETRIQYHLAKSLDDLTLYHSAQHYFMEVVRKGPSNPYFKYALPRLIRIAERTGNDYELLRIVSRIPPESFPRQARSHLYYLMGRKLFEKDELTQAGEFFQQVSAKSDLNLRSKYYEGIIHQQRGKLKSAVLSFREVWSAEPTLVGDVRQAQEVEDIKDLALMNIARIYYGLQRFDNADTYYSMVPRESSYWAESLFERAWTSFMRSDLNLALGLLLTVESPYFDESDFIPEVTYLRALTFFNLCEYNEVERTLIGFDARYKPMQQEIEAFLNQYKDQKDLWDQAYDQYFTSEHDSSVLTTSLFSRVLQNRDLAAMVRHLELMDQELAYIAEQKVQWKDTVGAELVKVIEEDRILYKKKAGNELLREMLKLNQMLEDLLVRSEIVRFEVVDAQRADYEFKSQNVDDIEAGIKRKIDTATSRDIIYWPFNGEFWRDELGYYRYTEHGSCK
jgi:tetratricopeptide (TPR) repeat protein